MIYAIEEAKKGIDMGELPFGCFIENKKTGERVAAHNLAIQKKNPLMHAEIIAIQKMLAIKNATNLNDCVLYATTCPCLMCFGAAYWSGIGEIVYGSSLDKSIEWGFEEIMYTIDDFKFNQNIHIQKNCMKDQCDALYNYWNKKNRILALFFQNRKL